MKNTRSSHVAILKDASQEAVLNLIDCIACLAKVLSVSSLRLLLSPLQLMSAALLGVVQHRAVMHYGLLEDFITAVLDLMPDLLSQSEREQLVLGLRAKVVLEMCRKDDLCCRVNIEPLLAKINDLVKEQKEQEASSSKMKASVDNFSKVINTLLDDPNERVVFYQKTFPSVFGPDFDSAVCDLVRKFLINLEKLLPLPSLDQTSLWLGLSPPVLKECGDILIQPEPLNELIQHHKQDYDFSLGPFCNDFIFSSLSGQQVRDEDTECKTTQVNCSYTEKVEKTLMFEDGEEDVPSVEMTLDESDIEQQDCNSSVPKVDQTDSDRRRTFRCFVCGQTCCSLLELQKHIIPRCSADTVEKNKAVSLSSRFVISTNTSEEEMSKRSNRIKTCSVCGEAFSSSPDFISHMRAHTENGSQEFEDGEDFDSHENVISHQKNGSKRSKEVSKNMDYSQVMQQNGIKDCVVLIRRISDDNAIFSETCTIFCKDCGRRVLKKDLEIHQRICFYKNPPEKRHKTANSGDLIQIKPCNFNFLSSKKHVETDSEESQNIFSKENIGKCTLCDQTFSKTRFLKQHYRDLHKIKSPYQCPTCKREFVRVGELVKHHNDITLYECNTCKKCFSKRKVFRIHQGKCFQRRHTKQRLSKNASNVMWIKPCKLSTTGFSESDSEQTQNPLQTPNTSSSTHATMKCTLCDQTYSKMVSLKNHYRYSHKVTGPFQCPICKRPFVRLRELVLHHSDISLCQCNTCKRCFSLQSNLLQHKKQFNDTCATAYVCDICGKSCRSASYLKWHQQCHNKPEESTVCSYCGKKFSSKCSLQVHIRRHTGGFSCPVCPEVFFQQVYLRRHIEKHNGISHPYLCDVCGKDYFTISSLKVHMIQHSQERPFKCDQCDATYKRVGPLNAHILAIHQDHRPHVCSVCSKAFKVAHSLKAHMRKHTNVRPHVCSLCGRGFKLRYTLKTHMKTHQKAKIV